MTALRFAWRSLAREFRSGELAILALALVIAVAAVGSVGLFTDRVARAMERRHQELGRRAGETHDAHRLPPARERGLDRGKLWERLERLDQQGMRHWPVARGASCGVAPSPPPSDTSRDGWGERRTAANPTS